MDRKKQITFGDYHQQRHKSTEHRDVWHLQEDHRAAVIYKRTLHSILHKMQRQQYKLSEIMNVITA